MTERDPKPPRDAARSSPAQAPEKAFDPGHLGRHTMPIELRLELMAAELPRLAEEDLYHSPRSTAPASPVATPNAEVAAVDTRPQRSKTRRKIGFSVVIGFGLLAAMIGVLLLRAPRLHPQRVSPTSAIFKASPQPALPSATGSAIPPAASVDSLQR